MKGFLNRHKNPLPNEKCIIKIFHEGIVFITEWEPRDSDSTADKGYLGTARVISGEFKGIGFHAWEQNDHEFLYYNKIKY